MSYSQAALVGQQEAIAKARSGDFSEFETLVDKQLERQHVRTNPEAPRVNRNGELIQKTERMVRLKVNMGWIPKDTLNPLQFARMALRVKKVPFVEEISFLGAGRSWAEWFVDERHVDGVKAWLRASKIDFVENFNPMTPPPHNAGKPVVDLERKVIWRRALILSRGRFKVIRESALDGIPEQLHGEVRSLASRLQQGTAKGWKWPKPQFEQELVDFDNNRRERTRVFQPISLEEARAIAADQNAAQHAGGEKATFLRSDTPEDNEMEDGEHTPCQC
jgi:hypothetical protein